MRKSLPLFLALSLACATTAFAQPVGSPGGINFSWDDCWLAGGVAAKNFACTSNSGNSVMVGSFAPSIDQPLFVGVEVVVDLQSDTAVLPDWWQFFNLGTCRATALSATFDFSVLPGSCADPFGQPGQGGMAGYCGVGANCVDARTDPSQSRIKAAGAIASEAALTAGTEYYGVRFAMTNTKTVGTGSCAGCATGVTLILNEIKSAEFNGQYVRNYNPIANQCITWNSGTVPCASLPARNQTWGQVKSLYR